MKAHNVWLVILWLMIIVVCWGVIMAPEYFGSGKFNKAVPWSAAVVVLVVAGGLILTYRVKK